MRCVPRPIPPQAQAPSPRAAWAAAHPKAKWGAIERLQQEILQTQAQIRMRTAGFQIVALDALETLFGEPKRDVCRPPSSGCTGGVPSAYVLQNYVDAAAERRQQRYGAPPVTLEALIIEFGEGGLAAFEKPANRERLTRLSSAQLDELMRRLEKVSSK
jgi:hypothetical protein